MQRFLIDIFFDFIVDSGLGFSDLFVIEPERYRPPLPDGVAVQYLGSPERRELAYALAAVDRPPSGTHTFVQQPPFPA